MAGVGNTQIIGGKAYTMYTPEWQAARDADTVHQASVEGTAAGTAQGSASRSAYATEFPGWQYPTPGAMGADAGAPTHLATTSSSPALQGLTAATTKPPFSQGSANAYGDYERVLGLLEKTAAPGTLSTGASATATLPAPAAYGSGPTADQTTAARDASFARTKDDAANTASASLSGLSDALASRGMQGGGYEAGQIGSTLAREANTIGENDRQQAESDRADATHRADTAFQGAIVQRGQDISAATAQNNLLVQQAQLATQQRSVALAGLESALSTTARGAY